MKKIVRLTTFFVFFGWLTANIYACPVDIKVECIDLNSDFVIVALLSPLPDCSVPAPPDTPRWGYEDVSELLGSDVHFWITNKNLSQTDANGNLLFPYWEWHNSTEDGFLGPYAVPIQQELADINNDSVPDVVLHFLRGDLDINSNSVWGAIYLNGPPPIGGFFHGTVPVNFCPTPAVNCTHIPFYWKTHSKYGPAPYDITWIKIGEDTTFYLSGKSFYQVLWTNPIGNAYYFLAHAHIAAILNQLNGAKVPKSVADAMTAANGLFNNYSPAQIAALKNNAGGIAIRAKFIILTGILDAYNFGLIGPGHCRD